VVLLTAGDFLQSIKGDDMTKNKTMTSNADVRERNKVIVRDVLNMAFNEKNVNAAASFLTDRYIQHNPYVPTGKSGFLTGIAEFYRMYPDLSWEFKNIWADGDYVIVHSLYKFSRESRGSAAVDIFRVLDGKIDEHWDVIQDIPDRMAHDNSMF
jgi:predicted SnoaL-like aldol condensation-catalyzing enzyme